MRKKFVIFDMDGVIFDTEKVWRKAFLNAGDKFNIPKDEALCTSMCGKKAIDIIKPTKEIKKLCEFIGNNLFDIKDYLKENL